tara:strand:- start:3911 stop:7153 length:3243 start_codon:yes stop_codon:yes gene_type:complete
MNYYIIITILFVSVFPREWNYSADILEKTIENGKEVRIFKSKKPNQNNVIISSDTISIITQQAKQYIDSKELHLINSVIMVNGNDSLNCQNMKFWYDIDSLEASGNVHFKFKNSLLVTDSLLYVQTNGFRGYSFEASGNAKLLDSIYNISANKILYNDYKQKMDLINNAAVYSKNRGAYGDLITLEFHDSLIQKVLIKNNSYIFNNHYALANNTKYQLFKDEMYGNTIEMNLDGENLNNVLIQGMGKSIYYIVNDIKSLMGYNEATGDTINLNYKNGNLNTLKIVGDARGIFYPEKGQTKIDSILNYKANSIDYDIKNEMTVLSQAVEIEYQNTTLLSNNVKIDWNMNNLYATSTKDEQSEIISQNQKPITGKNLEFDLINKKGVIILGETMVGDGIYKSNTIYRQEPNIYHMDKSLYTTCEHEHPHYYFKAPKMKMLQGERIIAKPLFLYIYDIPVLGIPFAILPNKNSNRQTGWIMPSFGVSQKNGTYFQKLGYYWAPNDYMDSKLLMDFYDRDRIELRGYTRYVKRYKFNGSISTTLKRELNQELTNDISDLFTNKSIQNFDIKWIHKHQIDPSQNLNINWTYVTSSDFYNEFGYDLNTRTKQKLESSASYNKVWKNYNNRLSISISESYDLNSDGAVPDENTPTIYYKSRILPNMKFSHSNSKIFGNGDKWYNSIYYSFSSKFNGRQSIGHTISGIDTINYKRSVSHILNFSAPNKLFKWLTFNPIINLKEGWIFEHNDNGIIKDGFKRRLTGTFALSTSTTLYGLFPINNFNINSIRHIIYPTISLNYAPDFSKPILGIDLGYFNSDGFDYFSNSMIGSTPTNETKRMSFNIRNNFQMKLNDSTNTKIDFLTWNISSGYNFKNDIKLDIIKSRINLSIPKSLDIDVTMYHDPYKLNNTTLERTNKLAYFPILTYIEGSTDISLTGKNDIKKNNIETEIDTLERDDKTTLYNSNNFFEPNINTNSIWDLDLRIGAKLQKTLINQLIDWDKTLWVQPILQLQITEKWKLTYSGQIDMINNEIISHNMYLYRSLHCWEFGFKWWPSGSNSGFLLNIRVKSPNLRDIKIRTSGGSLFGI